MKLKIDKTFMIILGLILILGVALNIQSRSVSKLKQENVYYENKYRYLEEYALTLEQCLWTLSERISLAGMKLTEANGNISTTLPPKRLVVNCCNLAADSVRQSNMLEVLGNCRHIGQLQVITDSAGIEPIKAMLKAHENSRIWIAAEENAWQNYPSLFLTDEENRAVYGLMITPRTMRLVVRYLRFIQNQYDFE